MSSGEYFNRQTAATDLLSGTISTGGTYAGTGATTSGIFSTPIHEEAKKMKASPMKDSPKKKRMTVIRVIRSPKGHRVKLVGDNLVELAPIFIRWADRIDRDIRVVNTDGEAPYQFYGRPMVTGHVGRQAICLFVTGSVNREIREDGNKWRVGLDELLALKAPESLDTPDTPAYANIHDDKKVFIGRADGKLIYTMLYVPLKQLPTKVTALPADLTMKHEPEYAPDPMALEPFVNHVLASYERMMKTHAAELRGELTETSLREFCSDSQRKRQRTLTETIDRATREMRQIEEKMTAKAREIREAQKDLILVKSGALDGELSAQFKKLNKLVEIGLYDQFKIRHGFLVGMTTPIKIEHEGKVYEMGKFMVSLDRAEGKLSIEHETKGHPFHPHIKHESICLGSIRNDIPKLVGMERYAMVFQVIYEFLSSYNAADKYNKIEVCTGVEAAPDMEPNQAVPVAPQAGPARSRDFDQMARLTQNQIANAVAVPPSALGSSIRSGLSVTAEQAAIPRTNTEAF